MAWTSSNPVSIGDPTKKTHYDNVYDNGAFQRNTSTGAILTTLTATFGATLQMSSANIEMDGNSILSTDSALPVTIGTGAGDLFTINSTGFVYDGEDGKVGIGVAPTSWDLEVKRTSGNCLFQAGTTDTAATSQLIAKGDTSSAFLQQFGSTAVGTWFGSPRADASVLTSDSTSRLLIGTTSNVPAYLATNNIIRVTVAAAGDVTLTKSLTVSSGGIKTDGANSLITKVIDIGDWDMDTTTGDGTTFVAVAHGVTYANIRAIKVLIRDDIDANVIILPLPTSTGVEGITADSTNITITRATGGFFDSTDFEDLSFNRGWIIVTYTA